MSRGAYLLSLGLVPYGEAFELQRSLAGAVSQGAIPETVVFLEHPPVVTLGRRTDADRELHGPDGMPATGGPCGLGDYALQASFRPMRRRRTTAAARAPSAASSSAT